MKPIISIIITSHNSDFYIRSCITSILREKFTRYEIVVVDDASTDNSIKIITRLLHNKVSIRLITLKKNVGATAARNIGAFNSQGKYLFFLDNDTELRCGWSHVIINTFNKYSIVGVLQPKQYILNTNTVNQIGDLITPLWMGKEQHIDKDIVRKSRPVFSMSGAGFVIRSSLFKHVCGFDKDYNYCGKELDLSWRVWSSGSQVLYIPRIAVYHAHYDRLHKSSRRYKSDHIYS